MEDDILSFSIFTPYIEQYIYTGSRKMNLNIAIRFNEYEDKTYIWIGTPIITHWLLKVGGDLFGQNNGGESPPLRGNIRVSGAKNSALPILAASLLGTEDII